MQGKSLPSPWRGPFVSEDLPYGTGDFMIMCALTEIEKMESRVAKALTEESREAISLEFANVSDRAVE